jgi:hypothetical protein
VERNLTIRQLIPMKNSNPDRTLQTFMNQEFSATSRTREPSSSLKFFQRRVRIDILHFVQPRCRAADCGIHYQAMNARIPGGRNHSVTIAAEFCARIFISAFEVANVDRIRIMILH